MFDNTRIILRNRDSISDYCSAQFLFVLFCLSLYIKQDLLVKINTENVYPGFELEAPANLTRYRQTCLKFSKVSSSYIGEFWDGILRKALASNFLILSCTLFRPEPEMNKCHTYIKFNLRYQVFLITFSIFCSSISTKQFNVCCNTNVHKMGFVRNMYAVTERKMLQNTLIVKATWQ